MVEEEGSPWVSTVNFCNGFSRRAWMPLRPAAGFGGFGSGNGDMPGTCSLPSTYARPSPALVLADTSSNRFPSDADQDTHAAAPEALGATPPPQVGCSPSLSS